LLLVLANAVFVAIEFSLVAVDRTTVDLAASEGDQRAVWIARALGRLNFELSGAQLGITVTSLALGFVAQPTIADLLREPVGNVIGDRAADGVALAIALALASVVQMVVGELVPKAIAVGRPLDTARFVAPFARVYSSLMAPVIKLFVGAANRAVRRFGIEPAEELSSVRSRAELQSLVAASGRDGTLAREEVGLMTRVFRFGEKTVADVLTPRPDVIALRADVTASELARRSVDTGTSRFPVLGADVDDVIGVVHAKAVFDVPPDRRDDVTVGALMGEAFFVPETRAADTLLLEMRHDRHYLAVVVDEYGGTAGIVTLEDLVEELVGEIDDEHDRRLVFGATRPFGDGYLVSGGLHPDEVREECGFEIPEGEYETLAGFVLSRLGRIPAPGDRFDEEGWGLQVVAMDRHRIVTLLLTPPPAADESTADESAAQRPTPDGPR
jgi:CBS domain containing-hemolysin-like protein